MKIVASNSLTVSNVNDGTITHKAWSYSMDGADRFTTVYPNLNLLTNTKNQSYTSTGTATNISPSFYLLSGNKSEIEYKQITISYDYLITNSTGTWSGTIRPTYSLGGTNQSVSNANLSGTHKETLTLGGVGFTTYAITVTGLPAGTIVTINNLKVEFGSVSTSWMPSSSEVTTADWPSYIGQYTDFTQADSTNPSDYTWGIMRGNDGVGVKSTVITYANSTSGTTAPSTGWTSSIPSPVKGQYLWTKTVWTSTDSSSKTAYSVSYNSKDGTNGTNGTSGIIVSSVAPSSPQNGQLWQDTSTTPQIVKKWTGGSWVIWELYAHNLKADSLSALSANLGDVSAGTVKLMADVDVNGAIKKHGIYQSKMGLLSSGTSLETPSTVSNSQMGVANLNNGELRFIVTDYTENLKNVQETGMSDPNTAFINFNSYDNGKDVMTIGSSGDIVFKGITSQDTPWIAMANGTYYKNMFSRVYISYSVTATSTANIPLGVLPVGLRPFRGLHLTANAWAATLVNDRHIEVRTTGEVTLYNPANGASYDGEVSFTL